MLMHPLKEEETRANFEFSLGGRWVDKLVARLFATAGVGTNPGISQSIQNGRHKKRSAQKKEYSKQKNGEEGSQVGSVTHHVTAQLG
jgi:hypothetical protein